MRDRVVVGTRGSSLALAQTNQVIDSLKKFAPNVRYEVVPIRTRGDKMQDFGKTAVEGKSMFTKEIEEALIIGRIDIAIHSMKDLTAELPADLVIGAVPERANPRDVLLSRNKKKFDQLQVGARVGTSSARRKAQLLAARADLEILDMQGNVDTRLRKLDKGQYDAIVLAAAGLIRLGLEKCATEYLSTDIMLPAVGQGALAIQSREDDHEIRQLLSNIDDKPTHRAVDAERAFARKLGADCKTPVAAYARAESGKLAIDGMVAARSGKMLVRIRIVSDNPDAEKVGEELAQALLSKGAATVLEAA
jgi:hydroxymethylbilane synthase